jgi:lipoic acid synthetase
VALKTNPENIKKNTALRRPDWLKVRLGSGDTFQAVRHAINNNRLHTVCESARCPNQGECWSRGTATFMILGNRCTRSCTFCNVKTGRPQPVDLKEPIRVARAVKDMHLRHVVITMVARDDLKDGGARQVANTIREIRKTNRSCSVEALISDLKGNWDALQMVLSAKPDILNHNLETVARLQKIVRVQGKYERSLSILRWAKESGFLTKSGFMVGVGEAFEEIRELMLDLRRVDCKIITIGQYLPPTKAHYPLHRYYTPEEFVHLKNTGYEMGFRHVESGPLVRSSYHAEAQLYERSSS